MKDCGRQFGALYYCGGLGESICAMALNEAIDGGSVSDREKLTNSLRLGGFSYVLRMYVVHSIDSLTDNEVIIRIPASYRDCLAREFIADAAKVVLEEMLEDEVGDLNILGRISFELNIED